MAATFLAAEATSDDGDVSGHLRPGNSIQAQRTDCWLAKLNSDGFLLWNKCYGSNGNDKALSLFAPMITTIFSLAMFNMPTRM